MYVSITAASMTDQQDARGIPREYARVLVIKIDAPVERAVIHRSHRSHRDSLTFEINRDDHSKTYAWN